MRRMSHSFYSSDLISCGFYLLLTVKEIFESIQVADEDQFFKSLQEILKGIDQEELTGVFQAWVLQVHEVSQYNRYYVK
jgi:hypothetical protein